MLPPSQGQTALNSQKREPSNNEVLLSVSTTVPEGHGRPLLARVELGMEPHQWCAGSRGAWSSEGRNWGFGARLADLHPLLSVC